MGDDVEELVNHHNSYNIISAWLFVNKKTLYREIDYMGLKLGADLSKVMIRFKNEGVRTSSLHREIWGYYLFHPIVLFAFSVLSLCVLYHIANARYFDHQERGSTL